MYTRVLLLTSLFLTLFTLSSYAVSDEAKKLLEAIKNKKENALAIDRPTTSELHNAVLLGNQVVVNQLLFSGKGDVNFIDCNGETPLDVANRIKSRGPLYESIRFDLLRYRAKTAQDLADEKEEMNFAQTDVPAFFRAVDDGNVEKLNEFLRQGIDPNMKQNGEVALHRAVRLNKPEVVWVLSQFKGIDLDARNTDGKTPLEVAQSNHLQRITNSLQAASVLKSEKKGTSSSSGSYSDGTSGPIHVRGYYRKDGTYVKPHGRKR